MQSLGHVVTGPRQQRRGALGGQPGQIEVEGGEEVALQQVVEGRQAPPGRAAVADLVAPAADAVGNVVEVDAVVREELRPQRGHLDGESRGED
jgi:hypothetical protein